MKDHRNRTEKWRTSVITDIWSFNFRSYIFMPWHLVLHFQVLHYLVLHFQRPRYSFIWFDFRAIVMLLNVAVFCTVRPFSRVRNLYSNIFGTLQGQSPLRPQVLGPHGVCRGRTCCACCADSLASSVSVSRQASTCRGESVAWWVASGYNTAYLQSSACLRSTAHLHK